MHHEIDTKVVSRAFTQKRGAFAQYRGAFIPGWRYLYPFTFFVGDLGSKVIIIPRTKNSYRCVFRRFRPLIPV